MQFSRKRQPAVYRYDSSISTWIPKRILDFKINLNNIIKKFGEFDMQRIMLGTIDYHVYLGLPVGQEITHAHFDSILSSLKGHLMYCFLSIMHIIDDVFLHQGDSRNQRMIDRAIANWANNILPSLVIGRIFPMLDANRFIWDGQKVLEFAMNCKNSTYEIAGRRIPFFVVYEIRNTLIPGGIIDATVFRLEYINKNIQPLSFFSNNLWFQNMGEFLTYDLMIQRKNTQEENAIMFRNIFRIVMDAFLVMLKDLLSRPIKDHRIKLQMCIIINMKINELQSNDDIGWNPVNLVHKFIELVSTKELKLWLCEIFHLIKNEREAVRIIEEPCVYRFRSAKGLLEPVISSKLKAPK